MKISEIVASRMYSWVYEGEFKLNKGGRMGLPLNPFFGRTTKRTVKSGQAATPEMLLKDALKRDPNYQPDPEYTPRWEAVPGFPCILRSLATGNYAVRIMNPKTTKREFFVDGRPMTPAELDAVKPYLPARKPADPKKVKVNMVYVENLRNLDMDIPETALDGLMDPISDDD